MRITLTDREAEFMEVLWTNGPSTVAEVREHIRDDPAYTTVLTILRNLEGKGFVGPSKDGRAHRYAPLLKRDEARRHALRDLAVKFFKGSSELLLTHLVADKQLTDDEIKRLRSLLSQRIRKGKS